MNFDLTKDTAHDAIALLLEIHEWAQASHPDRESEGPLEHMTSQVKLHTDLMPRAFQLVSCAKQAASIFGMQLESQRESALERVTPDRHDLVNRRLFELRALEHASRKAPTQSTASDVASALKTINVQKDLGEPLDLLVSRIREDGEILQLVQRVLSWGGKPQEAEEFKSWTAKLVREQRENSLGAEPTVETIAEGTLNKVALLHVNPVSITAHWDLSTIRGRTAVGAVWFEQPTEQERAEVQQCGRGSDQFIEVMSDGEICLRGDARVADANHAMLKELHRVFMLERGLPPQQVFYPYGIVNPVEAAAERQRREDMVCGMDTIPRHPTLERLANPPTASYTGEPERQSDLGSQPTNWNTSPTAEEVANFIGSQHLTPDSIQPIPTTAQVEIPGDENLYYITEFLYKGPTITAAELDKWLTLHAKPAFKRTTGLEANCLVFQGMNLFHEVYKKPIADVFSSEDGALRFGLTQVVQTQNTTKEQTIKTSQQNCIFLAHRNANGAWIIAEPRSNAVTADWLEDPAAAGLDCDKSEAAELLARLIDFMNEFIGKVNVETATCPAAESLRSLGFAPLSRWIAARLDPKNQHLYLKHPFDQMRPIAGENFLHISWKAPEEAAPKDLGKSGRTPNAQQLMDMVAEHRGHPPQEYVPPSADPQYKDSKIPNIGVDWGDKGPVWSTSPYANIGVDWSKEPAPLLKMSPEEAEAARPDFIVTPTAESPNNEL